MNGTSRKILLGCLVICLVPVVFLGLVYLNEWRYLISAHKKSVGEYVFDFAKSTSKLSEGDSLQLAGLRIYLNNNKQFHFSRRFDYISDTTGSWGVEGFGMIHYITLVTRDGKIFQFDKCCNEDGTITMGYQSTKENEDFGSLAFMKTTRRH